MKKKKLIEAVEIVDIAAKGKLIGKKDGIAYLTNGAVPGDVVDLEVRKKRKGMFEGRVQNIRTYSPHRTEPKCQHFEHCGGCSWQNLKYEEQIALKEQRVHQQIRRIGGVEDAPFLPILGTEEQYAYRNKLEFTFVPEGWLTPEQIQSDQSFEKKPALGFHVPGRFDWVLHIEGCHLMEEENNAIRNFVYDQATAAGVSFYHPRDKEGQLRNLVLRKNRKNEWMVLLIVSERSEALDALSATMIASFPHIVSLWYIYNEKVNDSYSDCPMEHIHGDEHLVEAFERKDGSKIAYLIGPKSFFQTNSNQAERLYRIVYDYANIQSGDVVYDLYTGTGSIALFVADKASKVVGIEYVPEAIEDADKNARLNEQSNCAFFAGDMKDILTTAFIEQHGKPDVMIADPPRAGMHADVIERILETAPKRLVYVSCDPATQARDIQMLSARYDVKALQPVDMFPHTSHVENIALLELR
jgi:23S rRNA (uracil1939-C5)-methyltransferase